MNDNHMKLLRGWIQSHYENVQLRLPPHPYHPKGRNAIAHMWLSLKGSYGVEYVKDIPDKEYENCLKILQIVYEYAEDIDVEKRFPKVEKVKINTLDEFFE